MAPCGPLWPPVAPCGPLDPPLQYPDFTEKFTVFPRQFVALGVGIELGSGYKMVEWEGKKREGE